MLKSESFRKYFSLNICKTTIVNVCFLIVFLIWIIFKCVIVKLQKVIFTLLPLLLYITEIRLLNILCFIIEKKTFVKKLIRAFKNNVEKHRWVISSLTLKYNFIVIKPNGKVIIFEILQIQTIFHLKCNEITASKVRWIH